LYRNKTIKNNNEPNANRIYSRDIDVLYPVCKYGIPVYNKARATFVGEMESTNGPLRYGLFIICNK